MIPKLLAETGKFQGYATKLGKYLHIDVKELTRKLISVGYKKYKPVIEYKEKNGWIKDHVKADLESFDFVAKLMMIPMNVESMVGWKDENDNNYKMLKQMMEIKAVIQDEDSFYDMIELVRLKWIHEHWDRYEASAEKAYQLANFPNFYADLMALYEPLPQDEEDIPEDTIDYIKIEEAIVNGMERKSKQAR